MKVLLVPVSAPRGFGEYARAREIALAVQQRWPQAQLHFVLSSQAPYAAQCPFPTTLLPGSATLHTPQVLEVLATFRPDVVIFDNAGRTAQIRGAHALGARVVYVSSRRRQRAKAFRLSWLRMLSEHWIAYPRFIAGDLGWLERLKLRMAGSPRVRFLDTLLPAASAAGAQPAAQLHDFVLVVPGGGSAHPGARTAPDIIAAAAKGLAERGLATVLVGVNEVAAGDLLSSLPLLPQDQLIGLMRRARLVVSNGGDTLLQALACGCACVAVPIAHDQATRIQRCLERQLLVAAPLQAGAIINAAAALHADEGGRHALQARVRSAGMTDAMPQILAALAELAGQGAQ